MKTSLPFLGFLLLSVTDYAQPTIHVSDYDPALLSTISYGYEYGIGLKDVGSAGPNVTWDFSFLDTDIILEYDVETCPGSTDCSEVPGSTEYFKSTMVQDFYQKTGSQWLQLGEKNVSSGEIVPYEDAYLWLQFPMTYLQTYEDTYDKGVGGLHSGTISSKVDGFGTLITPFATYTDVLRQHITDVSEMMVSGTKLTYTTTRHLWYKAGSHHQLMIIINVVVTDLSGGILSANWTLAYSVTPGLSISGSKMADASINIYPNPVQDRRFNVSAESGHIQRIELTDALGRNIFTQNYPNIQQTEVFVNGAARGIYWCTIYTDKGWSTRKVSFQ